MTTYIQARLNDITELENIRTAIRNGAKIESVFAEYATYPADKHVTEEEITGDLLAQYRLLAGAVVAA